MSSALQVYFIRHGETAWSLSGQHTGRTDLPLTAHGMATASRLATALQGLAFVRVLTSPRLRAVTTCELAGLGAGAETDADLAEWDYGRYEGLRGADIRKLAPEWELWRDGCPGGETIADVGARADRLIDRVHAIGGRVALFSHGQFGAVLVARWIGLEVAQGRHFAIDPVSVSILGCAPGHPHRRTISLLNVTAGVR